MSSQARVLEAHATHALIRWARVARRVCAATARGWCLAHVAGCRRRGEPRYGPRRGGGDAACRRRRRLGDGSRAQAAAAAAAAAARAAARRRARTAARGCRQLGGGGRSSGGRQLLATPGRRWPRRWPPRLNLTSGIAQAVVPCGRPVGWSGRLRRKATRGAAARCGAAQPGATRRLVGGSSRQRRGGRRGGRVGGGCMASVALRRANASDALRAAWDECGGAPRAQVQAPSPHSQRCPHPAVTSPLPASSSHSSAHPLPGTPPAPLHSCRAAPLPPARHTSRGGGRPLLVSATKPLEPA